MEREHTSHCDAPLQRLVRGLKLENRLKLKSVIPSARFLGVILKEILLGRLKVSDVFATEFMDFCNSCRVLARLFVEVRRVVFAINLLLVK